MRKLLRLTLLSAVACVSLMSAITAASANLISVNERDFLITWNPLRLTMGGQTISCPAILHGSFHSSIIDKVPGSLDGHITSATLTDASCTNGRSTILTADLPWHFQFDSFGGELPEFSGTAWRIIGMRLQIDPTGSLPACLLGTDTTDPAIVSAELDETGRVTGVRADEDVTIDLGGGFLCEIAGTARLAGTGVARAGDTNNPLFQILAF